MAIRKPIVVVTENHLSELPAGDSLMAHLDPDTTTLPELIEALIASGIMGEPIPTIPVNTSAPVVSGAVVPGDDATTTNGTWTGNPTAYEYKWQEFLDPTWTDVSGETANTYEDMPAGEYRSAVRAGNSVGWSDWAYSSAFVVAEPSSGLVFDGLSTPNMSVSPRLAEYGTASGVASCFTSTPLTGKHYIEMQAIRVSGLAGVALYNEERETLPTNAPPGQWYEAAGFHSALAGWSTGTYANAALPGEFSSSTTHGSSGSAQRHAICVDATDPAEVKIWVRTPTLPPPGTATWIGGGDPAAGTDPTLIMEGEGPAMIGATLSAAGNSVEWIEPGDQQWTAPSGFVPT